MDKDNEMELN